MSPWILVVEDDADVRDAIVETLGDEGYEVTMAPNGAVALSALLATESLPGLVLLDHMMPVMDGERMLRELRSNQRLSAIAVVLITADSHATTKAAALGANEGLKKPIQRRDLLATVSRYLQPA